MILLSGKIPLETHHSGRAMGGNGDLRIFLPDMLFGMVKK